MLAEMKKSLGSEQIKEGPDDPAPAITSTGIRVYEEIRGLMGMLRKKGFQVWIVTAGPQWVVQGAAKPFGVSPEQVIGMRTQRADGMLTTEIEPPPTGHSGIWRHRRRPLRTMGAGFTAS